MHKTISINAINASTRTASFFAKPYTKVKNPSVLARVRKAVKKKKTDAPEKTVVISLDMPGFQRLDNVLAIFPVSRAAWYAGIAEGRYPAGIQIGKRSVAWSNASLKALIEDVSNQGGETFDTS
jgi:predicted DNA-binding transcriptional regulator AlpA